ncbi:hypothetical protein E1B28_000413 [Marasmius oreades]|uniref:Transmembrane protein n=1 Tax=Marasmius oreades TaxID=181124 RepID=A0A9P7V189_9AGAR|nr:uncharacterized protein E1B28_000413 [Marasmius oreades]KAG7098468.1 hypothetical protein E1B28_000413 [Marasmius oreades]
MWSVLLTVWSTYMLDVIAGTVLTYTGHVTPVLPPLFYLLFSTATLPLLVYIILAQHCRFTSSCRAPRFVTVMFPHDGREDVEKTTPSNITVSPHGSCKKSSLDNIPLPVTITFPSPTHTRCQPLCDHSIDFPVRMRTRSGQTSEAKTPPRTPTRTRTWSTPPRMFPHQRTPSLSARSVSSTPSLPRTSFKLSFWVYLLAAQMSALLSQLFEVCYHTLISSRHSEAINVSRSMFNFEPVIPEATDLSLVAMGFIVNLTLVVSVGCVTKSLLLLTTFSTRMQSCHPHTRTVYAPSNHSHSPQSNPLEPRKFACMADGVAPTVNTSNLDTKTALGLAPSCSVSHKMPHILPWIPAKYNFEYHEEAEEQAPAAHHHRQREGEERQLSTSSSSVRDKVSPAPPTRQTHISHISMYSEHLPITPPLTKDNTRTPPSTGGLRLTPPSLANHIRILTERQATTFARSHSHSSSFELPGVASLSMRIGHDPRFFHDIEDEDRYTIPHSPTPVTRKKKPIPPVVRVNVQEEVDVTRDIPTRPRTDSILTTPVRRRRPRRPWTSEGTVSSEGGIGSEGNVASTRRSTSTFSTFFSSISVGRWSDIFHLGSGGHANHNKSASQGSLRRADGFERLNDPYEKSGQKFLAPLPLDQWELEILELGLGPTSSRSSNATITPPKWTLKKSFTQLQDHTACSAWLSDPDPFAAPPRGAVTFVSSVKDQGVTRFGVGESREDFEQSQPPTRMSAWGKLVLPVPSISHIPVVPPLPTIATGETRTGRSIRRPSSTKNLKPASSAVPSSPFIPTVLRDPSLYYRPGLPRSVSTPDVRKETFSPSKSTLTTNHTQTSTSPLHHEMPVEEALLAQRLLWKLNMDSRRMPTPTERKKKRGKSNGHVERNGESDCSETQKRSKSLVGRR